MKIMKLGLYIMVCTTLLLSSCSDWLSVQPADSVSEDQMFKEGDGYRVALNGVYKSMSNPSLYGRELSWGLMSAFGDDYTFGYGGLQSYHAWYLMARDYKYTDKEAVPIIDRIWKSAFKSVVNCNNLIGKVRNADVSIFRQKELEKDIILGEALAARALVHFDILRLYAPAPIKDDGGIYVPYYDQDGLSSGQPRTTVKEVLKKVILDLKTAQPLLAQLDTISEDRRQMMTIPYRIFSAYPTNTSLERDNFFTCRAYRLNYAAITALLARVYNYMGEHDLAYAEAQKVLNLVHTKTYKIFSFTKPSDVAVNKKLVDDIIFTLSYPKLVEEYKNYRDGSTDQLTITYNLENGFDDPADYRKTDLMDVNKQNYTISTKNHAAKDRYINAPYDALDDMLPVIRMSEMQFIVAEYYASKGAFAEAVKAIDLVRVGRNCTAGRLKITDAKSFQTELLKEVRREFIGEAQTYYYYKKFGVKIRTSMTDAKWFFPAPQEENV